MRMMSLAEIRCFPVTRICWAERRGGEERGEENNSVDEELIGNRSESIKGLIKEIELTMENDFPELLLYPLPSCSP